MNTMKTETLIATIDQKDKLLPEKMNIQTDTVVANQCGRISKEEDYINGHRVLYLNTAERGVGKNRNLLLDNASGDICIMADDDMRFVNGYKEIKYLNSTVDFKNIEKYCILYNKDEK